MLLQNGVVTSLWMGDLLIMPEPLAGGLIALSVLVSLRGWSGDQRAAGDRRAVRARACSPLSGYSAGLGDLEPRVARGDRLVAGVGRLRGCTCCGTSGRCIRRCLRTRPWHTTSYIQFGGLRFVLATLRTNLWLRCPAVVDHAAGARGGVTGCLECASGGESSDRGLSDGIRDCRPAIQLVLGLGAGDAVALELGQQSVAGAKRADRESWTMAR